MCGLVQALHCVQHLTRKALLTCGHRVYSCQLMQVVLVTLSAPHLQDMIAGVQDHKR